MDLNLSHLQAELEQDYPVRSCATTLLEDLYGDGGVLQHPAGHKWNAAWECLQHEIELLLCKEDSKYKRERELLSQSAKPAVLVIAGVLTSKVGIAAGAATAFAAVALLIPLRVSVNAWCQARRNAAAMEALERKELEALAGEHDD